MKKTLVAAAPAALIAVVGCNPGTPGGPGVDKNKDQKSKVDKAKEAVGTGDDTFTLSAPKLATKLKQGESKEVTIGITRGKNLDQDVALKFDGVPTGVTLDPASPTIKHGDTEAKVTVKAAADATVGEFTVKVLGKPGKGPEATKEFTLTVAKK